MTSANCSNLFRSLSYAALLAALLSVSSYTAHAQNAPGYVPPPMFEDMTPPMVRPQTDNGYIVEPKKSENTVLPSGAAPTGNDNLVKPRVSVDPDMKRSAQPALSPQPTAQPKASVTGPAAKTAPVPPAAPVAPVKPAASAPAPKPKMMEPIVEEVYIKREKPAAKPKTPSVKVPETATPATPPKKPSTPARAADPENRTAQPKQDQPSVSTAAPSSPPAPSVEPAQRDPKVSAIKGPKTMLALPAGEVHKDEMFNEPAAPSSSSEPTILERQQTMAKSSNETLLPIVPRPKEGVTPATFEQDQDAMKKILPFAPGQIALPETDVDSIAAGVVKELEAEGKEGWRVQIKSFATPYGNGLSSDRRIALSRALSLRTALISQGVTASRIDVLAEGLQTDTSQTGDRIDLYLYGPTAQ